jgi:hypothetical protein
MARIALEYPKTPPEQQEASKQDSENADGDARSADPESGVGS